MRLAFAALSALITLAACGDATDPFGGSPGTAGAAAAGRAGSPTGGAGLGSGAAGASGGGSGGQPAGGASGSSSATGGTSGSHAAGSGTAAGAAGTGAAGASGTGGAAGLGGRGAGGASNAGASNAGESNAGASSGGGPTGGMAGTSGAAGSGAAGGPTLPPVTDYKAAGPFATTVEKNQGPGKAYTVYRPTMLGQNGFLHAPIIFGPGIGQEVSVHTTMLTNFASHGFVVVGTPVLNGGPGDATNRKSMQDGLDWIIAQNDVAGTYEHKLWVDHAISMGYSVGGTSAVEIGGSPAVATTVSIHGHKASAALHGPLLQTTGTKDTVGMPLQQQTYDLSMVQTFLATLTGADHGYIQNAGGGEERPAILAWMRYFIYGDAGAEHYFYGDDCVLCKAPWENPQRKNWP
jgi:hypothetical protein